MYIALTPVIAICDQHSGAFWRMEMKLQRPLLQQPIKWRPLANANEATATFFCSEYNRRIADCSGRYSGVLWRMEIRYDTIEEFNVDSKAEYSALSSRRSRKI